MLHIHSIKDIEEQVHDPILKAGLRKEFERLPDDFIYPDYGYFIVIESLDELMILMPIQYGALNQTEWPIRDFVEMIEPFEEGYCQIVLVLDSAGFGVSLFVSEEIATQAQLEALFGI